MMKIKSYVLIPFSLGFSAFPVTGAPEMPYVPPAKASEAKVPDGYQVSIVARDLTFPTSVAFGSDGAMYVAEAGYSYGKETAEPRILRIKGEGDAKVIASSGLEGPINDLLWHDDHLFVSHRGKISVVDLDGEVTDLVTDLPSQGDHHNNQLTAGQDGKIYFGQGTLTNSGVVGPDNAHMGWLGKHPEAHDVSAKDIVLNDKVFESGNPLKEGNQIVRTRAFHAFGEFTDNLIVKGTTKAAGTILKMNADGSDLEVHAWGLRNPYGVLWLPDGRLMVSENGMDVRGSRPADRWRMTRRISIRSKREPGTAGRIMPPGNR